MCVCGGSSHSWSGKSMEGKGEKKDLFLEIQRRILTHFGALFTLLSSPSTSQVGGGLEPKTQPYLDGPSPNYLSLHVLPDRSFEIPRLHVYWGPPSLFSPLIPVGSSLGDAETHWLLLERISRLICRSTCAASL